MCAIESILLTIFTRCPSQYRQVPDDMSDLCLNERELSPLSISDVPNHNNTITAVTTPQTSSHHDLPNHHQHYNKINTTSGSVTTPTTVCNQKPYIPGL